jgi:hypothetical protein
MEAVIEVVSIKKRVFVYFRHSGFYFYFGCLCFLSDRGEPVFALAAGCDEGCADNACRA